MCKECNQLFFEGVTFKKFKDEDLLKATGCSSIAFKNVADRFERYEINLHYNEKPVSPPVKDKNGIWFLNEIQFQFFIGLVENEEEKLLLHKTRAIERNAECNPVV
jgi:hypothetical protein